MAIRTDALPADDRPAAKPAAPPARRLRALIRSASGTFALNLFNTAATFAITAVLARVMPVADFGIYSWVVAIVYLLTVPAILGADRLLVRDIAVDLARQAHGRVRGLVRWSTALVVGISIVLALGGAAALALSGGGGSTTGVALLVGLVALPVIATARTWQAALMGFGQVVRAQVPEQAVRPALLIVLIVVALLVVGRPLDAPLALALYGASAAAAFAVMAVLLARRARELVGGARAEYQPARWVGAAVALALLSGTMIINSQTGVVLLGVLDTPEATAIYSVAQRAALLIAFPLLAVNVALAPVAARLWDAQRLAELQRLVTQAARGVLLASMPVALIFVLFGAGVLELAFGPAFAAGDRALAILSAGQVINAAAGSVATLLIMSGNQWRAGLGIVGGALLNVGLAVVLIPTLHADGAAIAASASLVVSNAIHVVIARRALGIDTTAAGLPPRRGA